MCVCVCACVCPASVATLIFGGLITARRVDTLRGLVLSGSAVSADRSTSPRVLACHAGGADVARLLWQTKELAGSQSVQEVSPEVASESGRQLRVLHNTLPRSEPDGGHIAPALGAVSPRGARWAAPTRRCRPGGVPSRWPAGSFRRDAGAAGREPVSSGGLLANFLLLQVGVCVRAGADRCRVCCCAGWVFAMSQVRACLHLMRVVLPGPILHAN